MHLAFITMLIWEDDAAGLVYSHKACRMSVGFLPLFDCRTLLGSRLAKKAMIKARLGMHLAVMDMHRREEDRVDVLSGKRKGHGMNGRGAWFEFEDGETIGFVRRQLVPDVLRQPKTLVQPGEVGYGRDERSFETANLEDP